MQQHPTHSRDHHPGQPNPMECSERAAAAYPTTREKLVESARRNDANLDIVDLVNDLPDENYHGRRQCPGRSRERNSCRRG